MEGIHEYFREWNELDVLGGGVAQYKQWQTFGIMWPYTDVLTNYMNTDVAFSNNNFCYVADR